MYAFRGLRKLESVLQISIYGRIYFRIFPTPKVKECTLNTVGCHQGCGERQAVDYYRISFAEFCK